MGSEAAHRNQSTAQTTARAASRTDDPRAGLRAVVALRRLADQLEHRQVQAALDAGHTWAAIAEELGVSRQAVHQKYHRRVRRPEEPR